MKYVERPIEHVLADVLLASEPIKVQGGSQARREWLLACMWILEAALQAQDFDVDLFRRRLLEDE